MSNAISTSLPPVQQGVEYRPIADFPGYAVGDDGSVWSCRTWNGRTGWRQLKPWPSGRNRDYLTVSLHKGEKSTAPAITRKVHRLVLEAFVGPCPEGMECRHFPDRNPGNNRLDNLRWGTKVENAADQVTHGTKADHSGEKAGAARLTWEDVHEIRRRKPSTIGNQRYAKQNGAAMRQLAEQYKISERQVYAIWRNAKWKPESEPTRIETQPLDKVSDAGTSEGESSCQLGSFRIGAQGVELF